MRGSSSDAWRKANDGGPLSRWSACLAEVIASTAEYHGFLAETDGAIGRDFPPELGEANPFLHLGLHVGIREQLAVDRPRRGRPLPPHPPARRRRTRGPSTGIDGLSARAFWDAQRAGRMPDERDTSTACAPSRAAEPTTPSLSA